MTLMLRNADFRRFKKIINFYVITILYLFNIINIIKKNLRKSALPKASASSAFQPYHQNMKTLLLSLLVAFALTANAQIDSTKSPFKFSGYLETYYSYDFGNPSNHTRPGFVYSHNRHNEVSLNLGFIKAAYEKGNVRANLALMTGSYANANLVAEPGVLKNIFEANIGFKVSQTKNIWVDAGIFPSHIGFESAIGKDCWNLTRSILADNSPYFETGVKVSYSSNNGQLFLSGLFLNGWQRIQRIDGNNTPAFGHQLTYKPTSKITLNSSSFVGSDTPDSTKRMRYFHDFYSIFQLNEKLGLILGFDIGWQQKTKTSSEYDTWYSPVAIIRYSPSNKINVAVRGEYYSDKNQVIIATGTPNGFQTWGYSANLDYNVSDNLMWRIEARGLNNKDQSFTDNKNKSSNQNYFMTTSLALSF